MTSPDRRGSLEVTMSRILQRALFWVFERIQPEYVVVLLLVGSGFGSAFAKASGYRTLGNVLFAPLLIAMVVTLILMPVLWWKSLRR